MQRSKFTSDDWGSMVVAAFVTICVAAELISILFWIVLKLIF